jgi:magnesium transporter
MMENLLRVVEPLIKQGDFKRAAMILSQKHPRDVAFVLERLGKENMVRVFKYLPVEIQGDSLLYLDENYLDEILETLSEKDISELVGEMDVDDAVDLLTELTDEERSKVLSFVPPDERKDVEELLQYRKNTAGGLMTKEYIAFPGDITVKEAMERLKREEKGEETGVIYVVDEKGRLMGEVYLRTLLTSPPYTKLKEIVNVVPLVNVDMDQEDVVRVVEKHDVFSLPVVDEMNRLRGVITIDDILDVLEEEATEDILKLGGLGGAESIFAPPARDAFKRLPWLILNLITAFIAASVVGAFKDTISSFIYLAVFMPVVAGMGGNAGTQTLAMTVRSIALGEVTFQDVKKLLIKEFAVGIIIGLVIGLMTGVVAYFWVGKTIFGLLVLLALLGNMAVACIFGFIIPVVLKVLGQDPALASGVIVTTVTDVTGFFLLLGLATLMARFLI